MYKYLDNNNAFVTICLKKVTENLYQYSTNVCETNVEINGSNSNAEKKVQFQTLLVKYSHIYNFFKLIEDMIRKPCMPISFKALNYNLQLIFKRPRGYSVLSLISPYQL